MDELRGVLTTRAANRLSRMGINTRGDLEGYLAGNPLHTLLRVEGVGRKSLIQIADYLSLEDVALHSYCTPRKERWVFQLLFDRLCGSSEVELSEKYSVGAQHISGLVSWATAVVASKKPPSVSSDDVAWYAEAVGFGDITENNS